MQYINCRILHYTDQLKKLRKANRSLKNKYNNLRKLPPESHTDDGVLVENLAAITHIKLLENDENILKAKQSLIDLEDLKYK